VKKTCRFLVGSVRDSDGKQPSIKYLNNCMKGSRKTKNAETEGKFYKRGGKTQPWLSNVKFNKYYEYMYI
jgi:hypothetical protein